MSPANFERRMSHSDALLWHIEKDPILRSTIVALAILDQTPDWDRLRRRVEYATLSIPRMRQRVMSPALRFSNPCWVVDPDFDLDFHLRRVSLPQPTSRRELLDFVAPTAGGAFDRARPLWEFTVIDEIDDGKAAVVLKVHHSVTDGVGGMELLARLVDTERDAPPPDDWPAVPAPDATTPLSLLGESIGASASDVASLAWTVPGAAIRTTASVLRDPLGSATRAADTARSIARTLAPATAPLSPLMHDRSLRRRLDTFDVPLDEMKRAAKAAEGSLNDAFVAATIGGLARYHQRHGQGTDWLRMTMPISVRSGGDHRAGNQFTPARFPVPASVDDVAERLTAVRSLVQEWRHEPALALTENLAGVLNRLPTAVTTALFGSMLKCVDFTATNVPGAPVPVFVGGAAVEDFYAFAPPAGASLNMALVSHVDQCCIGLVSDTVAVPDPDNLVADLRIGFDEVLALG